MVELDNLANFKLYFKYALRDLSRSYSKILSIIVTLFISLFILSSETIKKLILFAYGDEKTLIKQ